MYTAPIIITRASDDLSQQVWRFTVIDNLVVLDEYSKQTRVTKRHKFRVTGASYFRLSGGTLSCQRITEEEVPTPADVMLEARDTYVDTVRVGLWKRDFGK